MNIKCLNSVGAPDCNSASGTLIWSSWKDLAGSIVIAVVFIIAKKLEFV